MKGFNAILIMKVATGRKFEVMFDKCNAIVENFTYSNYA
jgi:hypothetical protein